jgi:uncharacterized protein YqfB (UPF0267 family)
MIDASYCGCLTILTVTVVLPLRNADITSKGGDEERKEISRLKDTIYQIYCNKIHLIIFQIFYSRTVHLGNR